MATRKKSNPNPVVLSRAEVASLLRVTPKTIDARIADGSLKAIRFGGLVRISRASVEELLGGLELPVTRS